MAMQISLRRGVPELQKEAWQLVCWRTATVIIGGKRTAILAKDHVSLSFGVDAWWRGDIYGPPKVDVERRAKEALEDLSR